MKRGVNGGESALRATNNKRHQVVIAMIIGIKWFARTCPELLSFVSRNICTNMLLLPYEK